jgi:hypothetical protein
METRSARLQYPGVIASIPLERRHERPSLPDLNHVPQSETQRERASRRPARRMQEDRCYDCVSRSQTRSDPGRKNPRGAQATQPVARRLASDRARRGTKTTLSGRKQPTRHGAISLLIVADQLHLTDWELLRLSPAPVLLVKTPGPYRRPVVLAAADPGHTNSKPAKLDERILRASATMTGALRGTRRVSRPGINSALPPAPRKNRNEPGRPLRLQCQGVDDLICVIRVTFDAHP